MVHRELDLQSRLDLGASVLLLGARSVGKTALAKIVLDSNSNSFALDLLNADTYSRYLKDPQQFTRDVAGRLEAVEGRLLVFVDEIQKVPSLMDGVHSLYESERGKVQFLLSGSSARKLKRGGANLLAGRLLNLRLHPLTSREWEMDFEQRLLLGSLPGVVYENPDPQATLRSYAHLYLKEEIQQEALVRRVDAFSRFLELAGQYHGLPINATAIGRDAGVSAHTISEYYQILEDTLMAFRLPGWSASARKQLRTAPRYYIFDNGVVSALRGELRLEVTPRTSRYGKLFESFVVQEAFRLNDYRELDLKFSYWQNRDGLEVDLIVSRGAGQPIAAIEIKSSTSPQDKDLAGLGSFLSDYPKTPCYVFCQTPHSYRTDLGVQVLPWKIGLETLPSL